MALTVIIADWTPRSLVGSLTAETEVEYFILILDENPRIDFLSLFW